MTITLSPEVEADIRELLGLWGWNTSECVIEAVAIGLIKQGVRESIGLNQVVAAHNAKIMGEPVPQSVPDARVFEELPSNWLGHSPVIPEGTQVRTTGGRVLVWRGGQWREEGGGM